MTTITDPLKFIEKYASSIGIQVRSKPHLLPSWSAKWVVTLPDGKSTTHWVTFVNLPSKNDQNDDGLYSANSETTHMQVSQEGYHMPGALPVFINAKVAYFIRESQEHYFKNLNTNLLKKGALAENWEKPAKFGLKTQMNIDSKNPKEEIVDDKGRKKAIKAATNEFLGGIFKSAAALVTSDDLKASDLDLREDLGIKKDPPPLPAKNSTASRFSILRSSTCRTIACLSLSALLGMVAAYHYGGSQ